MPSLGNKTISVDQDFREHVELYRRGNDPVRYYAASTYSIDGMTRHVEAELTAQEAAALVINSGLEAKLIAAAKAQEGLS